MKKYISCLLVLLALALPMLGMEAQAATSGTCGENLTWTLNAGTLTISGSGSMEGYRHYMDEYAPWYSLRQVIRSVVLEEGVTSIGNSAFYDCDNLSSISIPDGITSIDWYAFYNCSLSSITIPDSVTYIGAYAFWSCDSLSRVDITDIAAWCNIHFDGEYGSIPTAENGLYLNGKPITNVVLPESVTFIPEHAFRNCTSLSSITLPNSVTSIGDCAFYNCTSLSSITIPDSVTSIGDYVFDGCDNLDGIWVNNENLNYSSDDRGVLFDKDKSLLLDAPESIVVYSVPETVLVINDRAFEDCKNLISVTIPEGVVSLGDDSFYGCSSLTNVTIPDSVAETGYSAFSGCSSLKSVTIGDGVTEISALAFYNCSSLANVIIPDSVTVIEDDAFDECNNLTTVHYGGTEAQRASITIDNGNWELETANWHYECDGASCPNPFADVAADAYYAEPVLWAVNNGITNGLSENTFGPAETCTRGQIVTFLWRANGSPEPKNSTNPFWDVTEGDYFYKAVLWAVEKGITSGMGDGSFAPGTPCTRGQVATFLWRACGQPAPSGTNIFTDIAPGAYYYDAVLWAVENGITNGMGDGTFAPDAPCTRGQIVTFLYRAMA